MPVTRARRLPALALGLLALAPAAPARGHGEAAYRLAEPPAAANVRAPALESAYRLLSDLELRFPTDLQPEALARAEAIYHVIWDWRPAPPDAAEVSRTAAATRDFLRRIEAEYPTARVTLGPAGVRLQRIPPVALARGVERCVLLRLTNAGPTALRVRVQPPDAPPTDLDLPAPAGDEDGVRRVILPALVRDAAVTRLPLSIALAQAAPVSLALPVRVSEPALIRGRAMEGGHPWPGRIHVHCSDGILRHGAAFAANATLSEKPVVFRPASYRIPFFYSDGAFEIAVPAGPTRIALERGFEHDITTRTITPNPGQIRSIDLASSRFVDLRARGWISGDTHVHWVRNSWDVNEDLSLLGMVQRAEDIRVVNNLTLYQFRPGELGGSFIKPDHYPMGPVPGMCADGWHVQMAEEYRNDNHYGHINLLGLRRLIEPLAVGAGSGGPPGAPEAPTNRGVVLETRRQGGISIEAHNIGPFNASAVPASVALGLSDSLDQIDPEHYYRFLNCGFHIGLSNGSDHPARLVGCARVYARLSGPFTYARWLDAVRLGRTFTTSGPILLLRVNGRQPGDTLDLNAAAPVDLEVRALSRFPLGVVQIISNGEVIHTLRTSARRALMRLRVPIAGSRWFCARASSDGQFNAILSPNVAHTSAVYVRLNGRETLDAAAARGWIENLRIHRQRLETAAFAEPAHRAGALAEADQGIRRYEEIAAMAAIPPQPAAPASTRAQPDGPRIALTPLIVNDPVRRASGMREGQDLSRIAFRLQAPWMTGPVELRFPETMRSSMGMHFLDHYLSALRPISEWERYPEWEADPADGSLRYDFLTPEGLQIRSHVRPVADTVELTFTATNRTGQTIERIEANCCLDLGPCPELNARYDLSRLLMSFDGAIAPLTDATPTPAEVGRDPWLLILTRAGAPAFAGPRISPTWWRINQLTDRNLMAAVSADRKRLLGYTWSVEPEALMSNGGNPCLHTGMGFSPRLEPGRSFTWRGRIYCMPNDPAELIRRYEADQAAWRAMPRTD